MKTELKRMLEEIEADAKYTAAFTGRSKFSDRVMQAIAQVDRVKFVPEGIKPFAYENNALSIGYGQTISQPYIVALMSDILDLEPEHTVLEIGTGSGYQAAILSRLANKVYSIERVTDLYNATKKLLKKLGYDNIELRNCNGYYGWHEKAPFDAIIVTAAATHIPPDLIDQLKPGGRMVIPLGLPYMHQELMLVIKQHDDTTKNKSILGVSFVPLVTEEVNKETTL